MDYCIQGLLPAVSPQWLVVLVFVLCALSSALGPSPRKLPFAIMQESPHKMPEVSETS